MKARLTQGEYLTIWSLATHARLLMGGLEAVRDAILELLKSEGESTFPDVVLPAWNDVCGVVDCDKYAGSAGLGADHARAKRTTDELLKSLGIIVEEA